MWWVQFTAHPTAAVLVFVQLWCILWFSSLHSFIVMQQNPFMKVNKHQEGLNKKQQTKNQELCNQQYVLLKVKKKN